MYRLIAALRVMIDRSGRRSEEPVEAMIHLFAEAYRLRLLRGLDETVAHGGWNRVAGVDEAGRGCLAGPVTAAAVIAHPRRLVPGVDDSKNLGAAGRERLAKPIRRQSIAWSVAHVTAAEIDRINILEATRLAMRRALMALDPGPDLALIDAVALSDLPFPSLPVIRGDAISYSIAAASILAKVERDRLMAQADTTYPQYGFASHKGYGSSAHRQALEQFGPCPLHRLTFRSVLPREQAREPVEQGVSIEAHREAAARRVAAGGRH